MTENTETGFWAIVEIMGRKQYAGYVSEQILGGASFVRVDVPKCGDCEAFSKMFGAGSIYCITPISEAAARGIVARLKEQPISTWDLPQHWQNAIRQGQLQFDSDRHDGHDPDDDDLEPDDD